MILSHAPPCSCKSKEKEKEKKRNINNNLAVLPSHDNRIGDNSDIIYVVICYSRNETYVDGYELGFSKCDIHSLALELISDTVVVPDMDDCIYNIGLLTLLFVTIAEL